MNNNPIVAGLYPDPSICRVEGTFYLTNSSLEYFPGLPVFRSDDLSNWEQIGNALDRTEQADLSQAQPSGGIWAPTLRFYSGRFWIVTTDMTRYEQGQMILTATDPAGPWSNPIFINDAVGIDPDIAWDETGVCLLTWLANVGGRSVISQAEVNLSDGSLIGETRPLWQGTGLAYAEAPHIFQAEDWWYLVIAEGGTERGHACSIARAKSPRGPFEASPSNPFFTHRSTARPVQNTGHADFVQLASGDWAMVFLGVRVRGSSPQFHVNGRETFVAGVNWIDGWPVVDEERYAPPAKDHSFVETFANEPMHHRWITAGDPVSQFVRKSDLGGVILKSGGGGRSQVACCSCSRRGVGDQSEV